jgi:hypothetical protein
MAMSLFRGRRTKGPLSPLGGEGRFFTQTAGEKLDLNLTRLFPLVPQADPGGLGTFPITLTCSFSIRTVPWRSRPAGVIRSK